jgi:ABC-2 type transport system permease protein
MHKFWLIGIKDVTLAFRDRAALLLMLLAPFLLTVGLGFVTGRFSGNTSGLSHIHILLVNLDQAELGNTLVDVFESADLAELIAPERVDSEAEARRRIDADEASAAIIIPVGYTDSVFPANGQTAPPAIEIILYANPARPTGAGIVQTIVEEFTGRVELGRIGSQVVITQLLESGRLPLDPAVIAETGRQISEEMAAGLQESAGITLDQHTRSGEAVTFDVLAYLAPGMALMFLMFTVSNGGRTLLMERAQGTLPRLLVSPTSSAAILGGKVLGIYLTGVAQLVILIGGSSLLFNLKWGDPLGLAALILAAVFGATGWGLLLTALARTPGQVSGIGSALMLTFGILGGSFVSLDQLPTAVQWVSKITPNAWGLDGFTTLALGGTLANLGGPLAGLGVMGALLFTAALLFFNRQTLAQR